MRPLFPLRRAGVTVGVLLLHGTGRDSFDGPLSIERAAGGGALRSLGTRDFEQEWSDDEPPPGRAWYYARTVQVDGETAWSSPIYVTAK